MEHELGGRSAMGAQDGRTRMGWGAPLLAGLSAVLLSRPVVSGWASALVIGVSAVVLIVIAAWALRPVPLADSTRRAAVKAAGPVLRWLREDHPLALRKRVLGCGVALLLVCLMMWVLMPQGRLGWAMVSSVVFGATLFYAAHKCCHVKSRRGLACSFVASTSWAVMGNYLASATAGSGTDAKVFDTAFKPVMTKIDAVAADLGLVKKGVEKAVELGEENGKKIDAIADRLLAMVNERDATIGDLQQQLRNAVERAVRTAVTAGKSPDEAVADVDRADPKQLIESLDREIARSEKQLIDKHRERAAVCYVVGEIDKAESSLLKILALSPDDLDATNSLGHVKRLRGEFDEAALLYTRVGELAITDAQRAVSYGNLGVIERTRGNLDAAESYHKRSLMINQDLENEEGVAIQFGNLGLIERTRGNPDAAESYFKKSLALNEKLGRTEGMAVQYGNLGLIELARRDLDAAEGYVMKSLALNERLGLPAGMANQYGSLGVIERMRGNLDAAERYHKRALAIEEKLGRLEGMAASLGNLGLIEQLRRNPDTAEDYHKRALAIEEQIDRPTGIADQLGNLGVIELNRENLDAAEAHLKKSLAINEKLGRPAGIANQLGSLGLIEQKRGNLDEARAMWVRARDHFVKSGMKSQATMVQGLLDGLEK